MPTAIAASASAVQRMRGSAAMRSHSRSRNRESPKSRPVRAISAGSANRVVAPATASQATVKQASCARPFTPENMKVRYAMHVLATPVASVGHKPRAIATGS